MKKAQLKGFIDELSKIGDKTVAKALNQIVFRPSTEEVSGVPADQGSAAKAAPNPIGGADLGQGQSNSLVSSSQRVSPAMGPGGV